MRNTPLLVDTRPVDGAMRIAVALADARDPVGPGVGTISARQSGFGIDLSRFGMEECAWRTALRGVEMGENWTAQCRARRADEDLRA